MQKVNKPVGGLPMDNEKCLLYAELGSHTYMQN